MSEEKTEDIGDQSPALLFDPFLLKDFGTKKAERETNYKRNICFF